MSGHDKKSSTSRTGGIRTLSDLNKHDSDSDADVPQEYYTGGEKSGMLVQDPQKKKNDVEAIFEQARQMNAVQGPSEGLQTSSSSTSFTGAGRLLSGEPASAAASSEGPEPIVHVITFWQNGFSVDDGPLRRIDDPANAPFLDSIRQQECPKELEPKDRKTPVHVHLKKMDRNFTEPEIERVSFQGVGRTLGSSATLPPITTAPAPFRGLVVDRSLPSTSIQLRLLDGTRMVVHFNNHHTIADIRGFIDASRPMGSSRAYQLQAVGFPPKVLTDLTQTIEQAGLLNSVVIQKL